MGLTEAERRMKADQPRLREAIVHAFPFIYADPKMAARLFERLVYEPTLSGRLMLVSEIERLELLSPTAAAVLGPEEIGKLQTELGW